MKLSFYSLTYSELLKLLLAEGFNSTVASHLFNWHYKKKNFSPCELRIAKAAKAFVYENLSFDLPHINQVNEAEDKTVKFLISLDQAQESGEAQNNCTRQPTDIKLRLRPNESIETVLIPFQGKYSLCVSSQVGCGMNCSFCFTGTQGLKRSLKTEEIVGQFLIAQDWLLRNRPNDGWISNIVFMGQGEPLHNFEAVAQACQIFLSQYGLSLGPQKITISTSGWLPGLVKWEASPLNVNLALSLHSTKTNIRNTLIPINKKYPLQNVLETIDRIPLQKKQFVTYEYLLIADINDSSEEAMALGELLKSKRALINLIPFNPFPGSKFQRPSITTIQNFKAILDTFKIPTMIRSTKGDQVLAACGQLTSLKNPPV